MTPRPAIDMEGQREVEAQCHFCPNECPLLLSLDGDQIVRAVKRRPPRSGCGAAATGPERHCQRLAVLRGQRIEKAQALLRAPKVPRVVVGGH